MIQILEKYLTWIGKIDIPYVDCVLVLYTQLWFNNEVRGQRHF